MGVWLASDRWPTDAVEWRLTGNERGGNGVEG